jgi:hypothetical protein
VIGLGLLGSVLLAVGAFGVGAVPASLDGWWLPTSGRGLSYGLCLVGVLLLLGVWWRLRFASLREVLTAAGVWALPLLVAPPLFSRDVYAYAGQAHLVAVGLDPYSHGPDDAPGALASEVDDVWRGSPSPYGPLFLAVARWLVPGQHVVVSVLLLRLLAVLGLVLLAWALVRLSANPSRAVWLGIANPLVLLHGVSGGHNDALMTGLLAVGLTVGLVPGAVLVVAAALVKLPAVVGLAFLPLLRPGRRLRSYAVVGATAVVAAVGLTLLSGLGWGWVHTLGSGNPRRSLLSVSTGLGALVGADPAGHAVGLVVAAGVCVFVLLRATALGPLRALGLALLAIAALGPVVQPWYLLWALPGLAAVAGARLAMGLAAASAVLCLLILPSGRHVIRPPLYGVPALLAVAAGYAAARAATRPVASDAGAQTHKEIAEP